MVSSQPAKICPALWYVKEAEEAARFYTSIFPDSKIEHVTRITSGSGEAAHTVTVVDFTLFGQRFQAMSAGPHHEFNDAISFVVLCEDQAELDRYWYALIEGGGREQACGWLIDRFGVRWQILPRIFEEMVRDRNPDRVQRVFAALLQMVKIDIAVLEAAYNS